MSLEFRGESGAGAVNWGAVCIWVLLIAEKLGEVTGSGEEKELKSETHIAGGHHDVHISGSCQEKYDPWCRHPEPGSWKGWCALQPGDV